MLPALPRRALPATLPLALLLVLAPAAIAGTLPRVPDGFRARLVATVPAVTYPCQVATAPDGALFVAEDPMDQVGPYEADHGRILLFRDGQDPIVFADGFRAIFGMAWRDGALYVMNMPRLTVLRDTDGDGKADQKTELFKDLGPGPRPGALNDHIVSGLQFGMDGYLYISVGDKGVPGATGPDGRKVQLKGGGTLRCRPDGTGLEVYSSGTRNHLEPNLDDRDNLFTYDNTDDGDGWWTRVTHHVDGGYYGYPYDYHGRPDRMLPRMAEYGGGSPCGAILYKEDAWPEKYRGMALWAEWGKGKVQGFRFAPDGATFKVAETIDFAVADGVENFRPIDLALSFDGKTLYVADWGMGGWGSKTEKVGRVFAITYTGELSSRPRGHDSEPIPDQIRQLDHPAFHERMRAQAALIKKGREALDAVTAALANPKADPVARRHLVWALDGIAGGSPEATLPLLEVLKAPVADLRAQAARALGERSVPIAVEPLLALLKDPEPTVRLQAVIALGRIGDAAAVPALLPPLADPDAFLAFSARVALRRIGDWGAAARGLGSDDPKVRAGVLAAMEQVYDPSAVAALDAYARRADHPADERARAVFVLAQVHRKARPWNGAWWGTRPTQGKPPARVIDWEGTPVVLGAIRRGLADPQRAVHLAAIDGVREVGDQESLPVLRRQFADEADADLRVASAKALGSLKDQVALPVLVACLRDPKAPGPVRGAALAAVEAIGTDVARKALVELLERPDLVAERQPPVIAALGKFKAKEAVAPLVAKLASPAPAVRAAAAEALGKIGVVEGVAPAIRPLVNDPDAAVGRAAIGAAGALKDREAVPALLSAADRPETRMEASLALAAMPEVKALRVYLRGLTDKNQDLRKASSAALIPIRDQAAPILEQLASRRELPPSALPELRKVFAAVRPVDPWRLLGPLPPNARPPVRPGGPIDLNATHPGKDGKPLTWTLARADDARGLIDLNKLYHTTDRAVAFGYAEVQSPSKRKAQMAVGSDDTLTVWLNGRRVYRSRESRDFHHEQDRFDVELAEGTNRILIRCGNEGGLWLFSAGLTEPADYPFLKAPAEGAYDPESYRAFAMKEKGHPARGEALFADPKGLACVKCHAVSGRGGTVGPDLAGIGARYGRDELITSVLYPSAKIFSGYEPVVVATADGRVLTGIVKADGDDALEIQDADANRVKIPKADIDDRKVSDVSLMPTGLAEGLSKQDFADLIAYLESLKDAPPAPKPAGGR
jgi:putative membrane-bound dehydrogenase-like protein